MNNLKVAIMTINYPSGKEGETVSEPFSEGCGVLLGIYRLLEPSLRPYDPEKNKGHKSIEELVREQLENGQLIATKIFQDGRSVADIGHELAEKYNGATEHPRSLLLQEKVSIQDRYRLIFSVTAIERLLYDYFLPPKTIESNPEVE